MSTLAFFLEESSAKNLLESIVPRLIPEDVIVRYFIFEGKQNLEKELQRKLRLWCAPDTRFIIIRDQDSGNCKTIKNNLLKIVDKTGKLPVTLVRIACHELETFFLGDLAAVEKGLKIHGNLLLAQNKSIYRNPDEYPNASQILRILTKNSYSKLAGSRAIAPHMDLSGNNKSKSFNILVEAIKKQGASLAKVNPDTEFSDDH